MKGRAEAGLQETNSQGTASSEESTVRQSRMAPTGLNEPVSLDDLEIPQGVSPEIVREYATRFYHATKDEPFFRTLPVFALDPAIRRSRGSVTEIRLPYEPLEPGPCGSVFRVDMTIPDDLPVREARLDDRFVLIDGGYRPDPADPRFHAQMVYAVAQATYVHFQVALGREPSWRIPFERDPDPKVQRCRLVLRPFGAKGQSQAWYDRQRGEVVFGFFHPKNRLAGVPNEGRGYVFLSLSHDVIVHEVTHALLDGLRPFFHMATHPDVPAFHEAFADLVAVLERFTQRDIVRVALREAKGDPSLTDVLSEVGRQFGLAVRTIPGALRTLYPEQGTSPERDYPSASETDQHLRGNVLARAVFAAFREVYEARSTRFVRAATGGRSDLREEDLNDDLLTLLVEEIGRIARQFIRICIRAIDYCPPVDVRFGDYLRALITADRELVPFDDWGYRDAIAHAFGKLGIYGEGTRFMSESALSWNGPRMPLPTLPEMTIAQASLKADPGRPNSPEATVRQAQAVHRLATDPRYVSEFGLVPPGQPPLHAEQAQVNSVRAAWRVGPDGQLTFDTIAEIVQRCIISKGGQPYIFYGGATVVFGIDGAVRFVIRKRIDNDDRMVEQQEYITGKGGLKFWTENMGVRTPLPQTFKLACGDGV